MTELQQVEKQNASFNNEVQNGLQEQHDKAKKQYEKQKLEEDNFVAEQAAAVENTIQILSDDQERKKRQENAAAEMILEDKIRSKKLAEFLKSE